MLVVSMLEVSEKEEGVVALHLPIYTYIQAGCVLFEIVKYKEGVFYVK